MRLIDADVLIEAIKNMSQRYCDCKDCDGKGQIIRVSEVIDIAKNEVPTAYDVDKVVMELEERTDFLKNCTKYGNKNAKQQAESYRTMMMYEVADLVDDSKAIVQEVTEEYNGGWIPVKTRPMTEEEKEYYSEYLFYGNGYIYECPLPDNGQEVLITSKYGSVDMTTFYTDYGNYFENYEDYDEVIAWKPLPKPFKERD